METGVGASTIALAGAIAASEAHDIRLFCWDINGRKQTEIRSVIAETVCQLSSFDLTRQLITITADAKSKIAGLGVLKELGLEIIFGFFDSMHTHEQLLSEIELATQSLCDGAVIYLDDHGLRCSKENIHLCNLARRKLGLEDAVPKNAVEYFAESTFSEAAERMLEPFFENEHMEWSVSDAMTSQLDSKFFSYFELDRKTLHQVGAELSNSSLGRAICYRLKRRGGV